MLFILVIHSRGFASVLIKVAMMPPRKMPSIKDPMAVLNNWPLGALPLLQDGFTLYVAALRFF